MIAAIITVALTTTAVSYASPSTIKLQRPIWTVVLASLNQKATHRSGFFDFAHAKERILNL